ncbi:putative 26S proteasome complex subunit sem-1 [Polychytrium aggregatum]|uniref:putative 26S proteasome complex subunit sem-1 n=1 Tax=Polychytrium aggregatum TaxID=110093 RepID=UPI0022FF428F|nr:putative 26S proteasome complex subunit sem-1 [Polychytrium aggregatum]KAI9199644.1 putative 26S proteasome complex subunit sem-1 [Polychytrium aggregatum]
MAKEEKPTQKEEAKAVQDQKPKSTLEDDDQFEDFVAECIEDDQPNPNSWAATWEDDEEVEDFYVQLQNETKKRAGAMQL